MVLLPVKTALYIKVAKTYKKSSGFNFHVLIVDKKCKRPTFKKKKNWTDDKRIPDPTKFCL